MRRHMRRHVSDYGSAAGILGALRHDGVYVETEVASEQDGPPWFGRPVCLNAADIWCDWCRELIDPETDYTNAWAAVLARQKRDHGGTWCQECFTDGQHERENDAEDDDDDEPDGTRAFG